jgi:fructan beta-fructosidase
MQYFVGEFDGSQFRNENPADTILRPDYGPDFYAGITYNNLPAGHDPVLIAWASNPGYAQATPTSPWRSAMSVPRSLRLKKAGNIFTLLQQPVKQLQTLRGSVTELKNKLVTNEPVSVAKGAVVELEAELLPAQNANCGIRLAVGGGQLVIIGYDVASEKLYLDRSNSGNTSFDNQFAATKYTSARVPLQEGKLRLHILFDKSIVEVFANDGATVITAQVFPSNRHNGIEFFSEKGSMRISTAKVWPLSTAWK